ncbi:MAG: hypothetical protein GWM98_23825, partial [Nitrospinaceae bacterium]|nr:hypothetical protein [Nitrospinaceae bacterium]NIR56935.1 hypothetical protein [Nitrospinaceae bacterium]NIS87391.1 hypothetical protein [Nitrospinaceae bacterium]NIT84243.1 hypothetical protein [Nitrospinaceae bacterium]NIU46431.1 hypothetical protein [Nitrospinaceae bacterium]
METRKSAKKTLTRIFLGFGLVLLLLIGGLVALLMFVEVDSLREPLARELSDATELRVELGPLHLDLSRGVGLKADGFRVRSQDGTRDLFSAEQLVVLTELEPLLHKQVKIQEATLVQPVVRIYLDSP